MDVCVERLWNLGGMTTERTAERAVLKKASAERPEQVP
jgi:hypothetical protein